MKLRPAKRSKATAQAGILLAAIFSLNPGTLAAQRPGPAASGPADSLADAITAACRQDQAAFATHLTRDNAQAYRALPEEQRIALLKRFVLLDDPGKPLLSTFEGHTAVRCEAKGIVSEMRFGEAQVDENLAFIPVTVPEGDAAQSLRFGMIREQGDWKLLSAGLLLLDVREMAHEWEQAELRAREQTVIKALRKIAGALKAYQTAYGKLPESLEDLGPAPPDGASPEKAGFLDSELAQGIAGGYSVRYIIVPAGSGEESESERNKQAGFALAAIPGTYGKDGRESFFLDSSGVLKGADKNGAVASATDPQVTEQNSLP